MPQAPPQQFPYPTNYGKPGILYLSLSNVTEVTSFTRSVVFEKQNTVHSIFFEENDRAA